MTPLRFGTRSKERGKSSTLPLYERDAFPWLSLRRVEPWLTSVALPLPGSRDRQLRVLVPAFPRIYSASRARFGRKRGTALCCFTSVLVLWILFLTVRRVGRQSRDWVSKQFTPSTLIFGRADLQRIWQWEILSGNYPSTAAIPEQIWLQEVLPNPALPQGMQRVDYPPQTGFASAPAAPAIQNTLGTGCSRIYVDISSEPPQTAYPPRPVPGGVADLDIIMEHCDLDKGKYVRDCLEVLRVGGGLDNDLQYRRDNTDDWKYIYVERPAANVSTSASRAMSSEGIPPVGTNVGLRFHKSAPLEGLALPPSVSSTPYIQLPRHCDPERPRLFHMFWTGAFTDKPYTALLSFLFTQNLGLHLNADDGSPDLCRPEFWLWMNPKKSSSVVNPEVANSDLLASLQDNPWSQLFLHPRFKGIITFKVWNTTERLDAIPELRGVWRQNPDAVSKALGKLMTTSTTVNPKSPLAADPAADTDEEGGEPEVRPTSQPEVTKEPEYDTASVTLSDLARFALCHHFGGIYLDADTLLLRDWEELWGWRGAFAYRWEHHQWYNTAIMKLNKGSAIGSFIFRTALRNGFDFHPTTVTRYLRDAFLEPLLVRLPDAMFDPAFLNSQDYQRERPPFPLFNSFTEFFHTPTQRSAAPQTAGFQAFFKGSYAYHWHNHWKYPFDRARNWPDLGPRFKEGELKERARLRAARASEAASLSSALAFSADHDRKAPATVRQPPAQSSTRSSDDEPPDTRDLDWATVLKRTFEAYIRGDAPNMYGEWLAWT